MAYQDSICIILRRGQNKFPQEKTGTGNTYTGLEPIVVKVVHNGLVVRLKRWMGTAGRTQWSVEHGGAERGGKAEIDAVRRP